MESVGTNTIVDVLETILNEHYRPINLYRLKSLQKKPSLVMLREDGTKVLLTYKQLVCLVNIAAGLGIKHTSQEMCCSEATIACHLNTVKKKMHAFSTHHACRQFWKAVFKGHIQVLSLSNPHQLRPRVSCRVVAANH